MSKLFQSYNLPPFGFGIEHMRALLIHTMEKGASALYITSNLPVAIKIKGVVKQYYDTILDFHEIEQVLSEMFHDGLFSSIMSGRQFDDSYTIKDVKINGHYKKSITFRAHVSSSSSRDEISFVARTIDEEPPTYQSIGVDPVLVSVQLEVRKGIGFIGGATNSGKSTTIASLIRAMLESVAVNINTLESPIEYTYRSIKEPKGRIDQQHIGVDVDDFSAGVRGAMRSSPDVILIGEVRDAETADAAISSAYTGHNLLTTIHINRAYLLFERLASFFETKEREVMISKAIDLLNFICIQTLVPSINGGRVAVRETLVVDSNMKKQLHEAAKLNNMNSVMENLLMEYGTPYYVDARNLLDAGTISKEAYNRFCYSIGESDYVLH